MMIGKSLILYVLGFGILLLQKCMDYDQYCDIKPLTFKGDVKIYPDKNEISIGDTIWFVSDIPVTLIEQNSNTSVNYSNATNFITSISLERMTGGSVNSTGLDPAANHFKYVVASGSYIAPAEPNIKTNFFRFSEFSDQYSLKIGIIPGSTGIFALRFTSPSTVISGSNDCASALYQLTFKGTDQHIYLYQNNRPGYIIEGSEAGNLYCFVVK
ncbi:hypothetical protein GS399_19070 [Pedobacter sp. HMF7647]|uniref:Uncharacterized protein n=1 Tax=Hufsiella arboris TaxID=2695275 RepID=A0A7K1YEP2_9SPHI|nr:hypothetical protein [Hufsiella arboris]MXV53077.1 hypothetical protein [Hufsiella arboris]